MVKTTVAPESHRPRRRDWLGLRTATVLSLIFHLFVAAGLTRTGLALLSLPTPDSSPTTRNIFKPKPDHDFPLEVSRSETNPAAHERPLDLPLAKGRAGRQGSPTQSRTVSQHMSADQASVPTPQARLPEQSRPTPEQPASSSSSQRTSPVTPESKDQTSVPTLAMTADTASATKAVAPQRRSSRARQSNQETSVTPRMPDEVAVLSKATSLPKLARRQTPQEARLDAQILPRQISITPQPPQTSVVAAPLATTQLPITSAAPQPQARTRSTMAARSDNATSTTIASGRSAVASSDETAATDRPPSVRALARPDNADVSSAVMAPPRVAAALPRSDMASATESLAPATPAVAVLGESIGPVDPAVMNGAPVPSPASRGGATTGSRTSVVGSAQGQPVDAEAFVDTPPAGGGEGIAIAAALSIGAPGSSAMTSVVGDVTDGPARSSPGSPGRISPALGGMAAGVPVVAPPGSTAGSTIGKADGVAGGSGDTGGGGPMTRLSAPSFVRGSSPGRSPTGISSRVGLSIDGRDHGGSETSFEEGLSTDGMALAGTGLAAISGGRRSPGGGNSAAPEAKTLRRAATVVLPAEARVREIALPFQNRMARKRLPHDADDVVEKGLNFLQQAQLDDGRWQLGSYPGAASEPAPKLSSDTAATGLALLSFLGAGHDHFDGVYADTVRRGLEFLMSVQKADGDLYIPADPLSNSCAWMYSHGIATMALCEAVGMTGDDRIRPAAARACAFISASRHPTRMGWRYMPRSDADLSVSGWMLIALRSGQLASVPVDQQTLSGVRKLLNAAAIPASSGRSQHARFHYNEAKPEQRPSEISLACMNALGTLMRLHTGWSPRDEAVQENSRALAAILPAYAVSGQITRDCYLWYYASQVLVHTGGDPWDRWYAALVDVLRDRQEQDGPLAGSWPPMGPVPDRWGRYGGRIYVTTLQLLTLEVPYRHLPTYTFSDAP